LAAVEAEAFLYGNWKNFQELEDNMSMPEIEAVLKAGRERQENINRFNAAIKGINIDEDGDTLTAADKVEEMKRRAEARAAGKSDDEFDMNELGLEITVEE
jgi:hypothetical protein